MKGVSNLSENKVFGSQAANFITWINGAINNWTPQP
jgi:hypothetical protein